MARYCYDGTFEGFLCAVARSLAEGDEAAEFQHGEDNHGGGLFTEVTCEVDTVLETAIGFRERFVAAVSKGAFGTARYAFHSQATGIEGLLWRYVRLGLEKGRLLHRLLAEEPVWSVNRIARRVAHEAHKFKGFVRFREVAWQQDGEADAGSRGKSASFLYAQIEPDSDILPFIAPHFCERVGDRPWMIHDLRRSRAAIYDLTSWRLIRGIDQNAAPAYTPGEEACVRLWRSYFEHLAIPERRNPKLQRQHVPVRYRRNLVEFNG